VALNKDLAITWHARLGESEAAFQLQLDSDDLLDAVIAEIGVLRRERRLRINSGYVGIDRMLRVGVEIDMGRLPDFYFADIPFRHKASQINFAQIQERNDGGSGGDHFTGLGGPGDYGSGEWRPYVEVLPVGLRLSKLSLSLLRLCGGIGDFSLLLRDLTPNQSDLRFANLRVRETGLSGRQCSLCSLDAALRRGNRRCLLIRCGSGLQPLTL